MLYDTHNFPDIIHTDMKIGRYHLIRQFEKAVVVQGSDDEFADLERIVFQCGHPKLLEQMIGKQAAHQAHSVNRRTFRHAG